jgi:hypothetical protein
MCFPFIPYFPSLLRNDDCTSPRPSGEFLFVLAYDSANHTLVQSNLAPDVATRVSETAQLKDPPVTGATRLPNQTLP